MLSGIFKESDLRQLLKKNGFATNEKKHVNEPGVDIIAIKNGYSFLIEFKSLEKRDNETYRFAGGIDGDLLFLSMQDGKGFFWSSGNESLTKTARLINMIDKYDK